MNGFNDTTINFLFDVLSTPKVMSKDEQRIAIAETCGWRRKGPQRNHWINPNECHVSAFSDNLPIPDYLNDLNAMWLAVRKGLTGAKQLRTYEAYLQDLSPDYPTEATAAQRAEAFLRTLNLLKP